MPDEESGDKYEPDALDFTPESMLSQCLEELRDPNYFQNKEGKPIGPPSKAFLIMLWDEMDDKRTYVTRFRNAGMHYSEIVALLEIVKDQVLSEINDTEDDVEQD